MKGAVMKCYLIDALSGHCVVMVVGGRSVEGEDIPGLAEGVSPKALVSAEHL